MDFLTDLGCFLFWDYRLFQMMEVSRNPNNKLNLLITTQIVPVSTDTCLWGSCHFQVQELAEAFFLFVCFLKNSILHSTSYWPLLLSSKATYLLPLLMIVYGARHQLERSEGLGAGGD